MILIREMRAEDIPASRELLAQLGYQMAVEEVRRRYDAVIRSENHALMVAEYDGLLNIVEFPVLMAALRV